MKPFLKMNLAAVMIFTLGFSSCGKKDSTAKPDTKALLTSKTWKIIEKASDDNKNGKIETDEYQALDAATLAEITLSAGGSGTELFRGNWSLQWSLSDERTIILSIDHVHPSIYHWHIEKLTDKEFNFLETDDNNNNIITFGFHCVPK